MLWLWRLCRSVQDTSAQDHSIEEANRSSVSIGLGNLKQALESFDGVVSNLQMPANLAADVCGPALSVCQHLCLATDVQVH